MANVLERQVTHEGWRNAVVKLTGVLDTSNISETPAIALSDFSNNDRVAGRLSGFRVDLLEWSISNGIEVNLAWNSANPQQIFPLSGRGRIYANNYGGFIPDKTRTAYDGSINLTTSGFVALSDPAGPSVPQNFTIILELVKLYS